MANEIRERFRERKFSYENKRKKDKEKEKKQEKQQNIDSQIKLILFSPLLLIGIIGKGIDRLKGEDNKVFSLQKPKKNKDINENENIEVTIRKSENVLRDTKIKTKLQSNNLSFKQKSQRFQKSQDEYKYIFNKIDENTLEEKIFLKFKKELSRIKNECEIIESEEYLITKYEKDYDIYEKAQEINKRITELLNRLEELGKEYKIVKKNNLIEDPLLLNDSILIDDIIAYKEKINSGSYKNIPNRIKLLNEYKYLYENLDKLEEKTGEIKEISDERVKELSKRNEKYKEAKNKIISLKDVEKCCNLIIEKNNKYLEEISRKICDINCKTFVEKTLKGMDGFFTTTLKYIGLLTLTPLRGLLPVIGAKTTATRKLLNNMRQNMHYVKTKKVVYSLSDYEQEINNKIYDVNSVEQNIEYALNDVNKLKKEFKDYFFQYNIDEYEETYKKILLIEESIKNSQEKVNIIKQKLIKNKEINKSELVKVKKLNEINK